MNAIAFLFLISVYLFLVHCEITEHREKILSHNNLKDKFIKNKYPSYEFYSDKKYTEHQDRTKVLSVNPPDHRNVTAMARFVVHQAGWGAVATISVMPDIKGYPFSNIVAMSDGLPDSSTGIPYMFLTPLDFTSQDILKNTQCTMVVSLTQTEFCDKMKYDSADPRCARVFLTGTFQKIDNNTADYQFAMISLTTRHPYLTFAPAEHHYFPAKLEIKQIVMFDWIGGPKSVNVQEYFNFQ